MTILRPSDTLVERWELPLPRDRTITPLPAFLSAMCVLAALTLTVAVAEVGPFSAQMVLHIGLMNVAAPVIAGLLQVRRGRLRPSALWLVTSGQLILLGAWHVPAAQEAIAHSPVVHVAMMGMLLLAAVAFWRALIGLAPQGYWRPIFALLATGKIACLIGSLLIFAPRILYVSHSGVELGIADQQMAGFLMISACPLSYLIAGVIFAGQWLADLERRTGVADGRAA